MVKTKIKIETDGKDTVLSINQQDASQTCNKLVNAFRNNSKIKHNLDWLNLSKDNMNTINIIAIYLISNLANIVDILSINKGIEYSKVQIENLDFLMHVIFANNIIMKGWMMDELKWKPLFILFQVILLHKHVMNPKFISLAWLIAETQMYWKIDHLAFLSEINFSKTLCSIIKKAHFKDNETDYCVIALSITHNHFVINRRVNDNDDLYHRFRCSMNDVLFRQRPRISKTKQKHRSRCPNSVFSWRYLKFVINYRQILLTNDDPIKLMSLRTKIFKACAYYHCKKMRTKRNKIKMKICKGCKLTYYCSKKCQKRDWVSKHRSKCHLLFTNFK